MDEELQGTSYPERAETSPSRQRALDRSGSYNWTDGRRKQFRRFDVKRGFATEEEAELAGLTFARKWIDDGKPKFARVEPVAEVDTCRGKSTAIKLRHPDTCHIRDFQEACAYRRH